MSKSGATVFLKIKGNIVFYRGKNVLVAGGAGLVGQSLIPKLLEQGAYVRATQYKSRKISFAHKNLEVVSCDLFNTEQSTAVFKDIDIAFLAAAKIRGAKGIKENPSDIILYNLELHARLIALAATSGVERCALISSSYVYPDTGSANVEKEGFEGDPFIPTNYGIGWMLRYLETLCKHFHRASKTRYAIIRPTAYYGPHDNFNLGECHVVPAFIVKAVQKMNPFEVWGKGEEIRSFTYVEDLIDGLLCVTEKYAEAEGINICANESYPVRKVLETVLELTGHHPEIRYDTTKPMMIPYKVSNPAFAKEKLGWEAKHSLREGLKKTIDWYLQHKTTEIGVSS